MQGGPRSIALAAGVLLAACSSSTPTAATSTSTSTSAEQPAGRRCLPVVAADCGCTYPCAIGTEEAPGYWRISDARWSALGARVDRWCVGDSCTDAFFGEIDCDGVCEPRAADSSCRFEGGQCVGDGALGTEE